MNKMLIEKWWKTATNADLLIELARGASLMAQSKDGCTPLHLAVSYGKPTHMRILLHWGADPMALDNYNLTPIFIGDTMILELFKFLQRQTHLRWDQTRLGILCCMTQLASVSLK